MIKKISRFMKIFKSDDVKVAKSARAGTVVLEGLKECDIRDLTFGERLAISERLAEIGAEANGRYRVVMVDGTSQLPRGVPDRALCIVDTAVDVSSLSRGDIVLLRLDRVDVEAYKIRMFTSVDGENLHSIKFDSRGVPSEKASVHPRSLYVGKLMYKLEV